MKIFFLVSRVPWPLEKGDKLRAYHQARLLARHHEVMLCALNDSAANPGALLHLAGEVQVVKEIRLNRLLILWRLVRALFSDKPFQVHYFYQRQAARKVKRLIAEWQPDVIYCQLVRTAEYVKHLHHLPKTLDYMDTLSAGQQRRMANASWWLRPLLALESRRLMSYENLVFEYFEHHTIISAQDRELLFHAQRHKVSVIPNGVDVKFFEPTPTPKQFEFVFTGNMAYPPNVECARWLAREVMPIVWSTLPKARLLLAGATPVAAVKALAQDQRIIVSGWMNDIRDAYNASYIFTAPMRTGSGLQNKLLEAMSMQLPCVVSPLVAGATGAVHGQHLWVADGAGEVAQTLINLLEDKLKAGELGKCARQFVELHFNWPRTVQQLEQLMRQSAIGRS